MSVETLERRSARRAYELGRLSSSAFRALFVGAVVAVVGVCVSGMHALVMMPLTLLVWTLAYWRGRSLLRGALYGLAGGVVTAILPMSVLRPCCAMGGSMTGADCCTMPGACVASGALVGIVLAAFVPYGKASWWKTALGLAMGVTSVAVVKCATLFAGEALGLIGGLVGGVIATACARSVLGRGVARG